MHTDVLVSPEGVGIGRKVCVINTSFSLIKDATRVAGEEKSKEFTYNLSDGNPSPFYNI